MNYYTKVLVPLRRSQIPRIFSVNYSFQHPIRYQETQDRWRDIDDVTKEYQLIYKAPMDTLLKYTNAYLTFSTMSVTGLAAYYAAFVYDETSLDKPVILGEDIVVANSGVECFTYLAAFIGFHIAVKLVLSNYVLRLYQNEENYIAIYRGHFLNTYKHKFRRDEVKKMKISFIITWSDAKYNLGSKKGILLENYFKTPEHFNDLQRSEES